MVLNTEQQEAADKLLEYIHGKTNYDFAVFEGFAGVGKSTTLGKVVGELPGSLRVGMTAPTHKAVRVLRKNTEVPGLYMFGTIHSFLGLKQNIRNGKIVYENDSMFRQKLKVDSLAVLIVDESSMLDMQLLKHILDYKKIKPSLKLILTGDPLQIPPVHEELSLAFSPKADEKYNVLRIRLHKIMRQAEGNPILQFATNIRDNIRGSVHVPTTIDIVDELKVNQLINEMFTPTYKDNPDYCKILAWTNEKVDKMNALVRNKLLNNPTELIVVDDELVADKPIIIRDDRVINTNEEMTVTNVEITHTKIPILYYEYANHTLDYTDDEYSFKVYKTSVRHYNPVTNAPLQSLIYIIHPDSMADLKRHLEILKSIAIRIKNKKCWVEYYRVENIFAQVKYNYALTVHKSQGSSYENCIVMDNDILKSSNIFERNRIRYVAVTRAKNKLIIVK